MFGEIVLLNSEDDVSNQEEVDYEFEDLLNKFSLRIEAVHNTPKKVNTQFKMQSKLRPNVSSDWLFSIRK